MHHISKLLYRRFIGTITPEEQAQLDKWSTQSESHRQLYERLTDPSALETEYHLWRLIDDSRAEAEMRRLIRSAEAPARRRRLALGVAASIAAIIVGGLLFTILSTSQSHVTETTPAKYITSFDDLTPGCVKATLTDENGDSISLNSNSGKTLSLQLASINSGAVTAEPRILNLEVPRGGEFKVILEDSTLVWLNSETVISYPEEFTNGERRVRLKGEAYFEVKQDADRPFYVETGNQLVRVYGTKFNIRSYLDEDAIYTTLVTGTVGIKTLGGTSGEVLLTPGYQSVMKSNDPHVALKRVDAGMITEWRHGRFVFEEQPLDAIMRDLSRWYDFSYEFADPEVAVIVFMGSIPRYSSFATAAQILENSGNIHFEILDGKVIIRKK